MKTTRNLFSSRLGSAREWWPAAAAIAVLAAILTRLLMTQLSFCDGHLVYGLDDTYIHMATAKNVALHGVWGITSHGFTNSESSILWPLTLALGYGVIGVHKALPLVLNVLAAVGMVVAGQVAFRRYAIASPVVLIGLLGLVLIPAIPVLAVIGMEHVLHCVLALWFAHACVRFVGANETQRNWVLPVLAALVVAARYEGLFLVAIAALLMLATRRFQMAFATLAGGLAPVVFFGLLSVMLGWQFLPNSLLVKSQLPDLGFAYLLRFKVDQAAAQFLQPRVLAMAAMLGVMMAIAFRDRRLKSCGAIATALALGTLILHVISARTGHQYYRYEAYLAVIAVYAIVVTLGKLDAPTSRSGSSWALDHGRAPWIAPGLALLILLLPVHGPVRDVYSIAPVGSANIYSQQYQMARFVNEHYADAHVALNDIGAVSFFTEAKVYDLWGLATNEVWKAKEAREYDTDWILEVTREGGVDIAIVYNHWFARYGGLPEQWIHVGSWTIPSNVVAGGDTVSFYALSPHEATQLKTSLASFADALPEGVRQSGSYVEE